MTRPTLGITAMELFACNPYRVLGVAVDTPSAEISKTYKKLLDMAADGSVADLTTPYDFDFLPPFSRSEKDLKTAYAKLASNGYRCFAFSDPIFSEALNVDDVMLNLRDITCYDCFLRCYMWLITNDRDFEEPELWVPLCKYIDDMIMSGPDKWTTYFDHRFPEEMLDEKMTALRSFYATFCDIILLPIKEMVRGSMKCRSAMEVLKVAKVNVDEEFPFIDIPQANLPKKGEKAPLLKIAVKDGEEYYDVTTGKMVNFEGDEDSAIESNTFSEAASSISADAIVGDEGPDSEPIPDEPEDNPVLTGTVPPPTPTPAPKPQPVPTPIEDVKASDELSGELNAPLKKKKIIIPGHEGISKPAQSAPVQNVQPTQPVQTVQTAQSTEPVQPAAPKTASKPVQTSRRSAITTGVEDSAPIAEDITQPVVQTSRPASQPAQAAPAQTAPAAKKPYKKTTKGLTSLVDTFEDETSDTSDITLTDEAEEEENLYTDTLIKMLRANRSSNQLMKNVDTKHVYDNGDSLGTAAEPELSMDAINMKKMDKSLLNSAYDNINTKETDPKKLREEKYRNININDMLNPTLGNQMHNQYQPDAIQEFVKAKKEQKSAMKKIWMLLGAIIVVLVVYLLLFAAGLL